MSQLSWKAAHSGAKNASIEDIVETRVISKGFIIPPSPDPYSTKVTLLIESLQNEIKQLKQEQQASKINLDAFKSQYDLLNSQIHSLDSKLSQYMQDQHQRNQELHTSIQADCREEWSRALSLQQTELQSFWDRRCSEIFLQERQERQIAVQNIHNHVNIQLRQELQQHIDTRLSTFILEGKEIEKRIEGGNQHFLDHLHTDIQSWWEQETNKLNKSLEQLVHTRILEEQERLKNTTEQPSLNQPPTFDNCQNNLVQKMEDKLHKHLQHMSHQYQALETTWRKKFDYMSDRCTLLERHILNTQSQNGSNTSQGDDKTHRTKSEEKKSFSSFTKNETNGTDMYFDSNTWNNVETNEPLHTSAQETSSDDEVETVKVVHPRSTFTDHVHPPENKRAKKNVSTNEPPSVGKSTHNYNAWFQIPQFPPKKRTSSKETVKSNIGSKAPPTFNFHLNQESAYEQQERLFRESADRVRAQQQEDARRKWSKDENCTFVEPVDDLTKLPLNHWKWSDMYARLGLPPKASDELVKKHYRKLCLIYHPDKDRSGDDSNADRFQGIKEAYESIMPK